MVIVLFLMTVSVMIIGEDQTVMLVSNFLFMLHNDESQTRSIEFESKFIPIYILRSNSL